MARLRRAAAESSEPCRSARETDVTDSPPIRPARRKPTARYTIPEDSDGEEPVIRKKKLHTTESRQKTTSQIRLAPLQSLSSLSDLTIQDDTPEKARRRSPLKQDARRMLQKKAPEKSSSLEDELRATPITLITPGEMDRNEELAGSEDNVDEEADVEESIWCGSEPDVSASEDDLPSPSSFFPARRKHADQKQPDLARQLEALSIFDADTDAPAKRPAARNNTLVPAMRPGSSSDKENLDAIIKFSPPRFKKPIVARELDERPSTPPLPPPSPTKLKSPSKRPPRVPTPPGRPSLDAFWTASAVNDWNDHHSPQKPIRSPRKLFEPQTKIFDDTPIASPAKLSSPTKRSKAELQARKDWEIRKIAIAESFLQELDQTITQGRIAALSASTGGVQIIWSKTLNSTAGRANWRRETTKCHHSSNTIKDPTKAATTTTTHKHFATIELASKVLTYSPQAETQLLNVLAHEFCHLANFMISGIKDQPHGASFKSWGRKCSQAFKDRGIEVTTKHSYEIEYKYVWKCVEYEECGMEFKRHSKSIDPKRHRCGGCKGNLVQVKPVPRGGAAKTAGGKVEGGEAGEKKSAPQVNGYAAYVKQHFASLKKSLPPGTSHKEVMEALGRQYRAEKAAAGVKTQSKAVSTADDVADKLASVKLNVKDIIELDD
ncbi:hypothetical protein CKM354_000196900 [Cercospora kikuchii]|uniref:SprT-like domain-containing protein n=1 Tax=Cercospora kikuchii TaxID=84275 RepID=A0A9P3F963_9PEZI|nr:uncharacterized protein CKM354_000196900 [Cercospora kikuchii]GIZ38553.1 hypothetical protein CKM354_000196900 [Cercospora kikuchii]